MPNVYGIDTSYYPGDSIWIGTGQSVDFASARGTTMVSALPIAEEQDPLSAFDGHQSPVAAELQRGVCRALRARGYSVITELTLTNGRRADVVALSPAGDVLIVEIKSCLLDYDRDAKWHDYLPHCDELYFAVAADFPHGIIPVGAGLILADRYGAEFVRGPVERRLSAARRKTMMLCFARAAALRLQLHLDPACGFEA